MSELPIAQNANQLIFLFHRLFLALVQKGKVREGAKHSEGMANIQRMEVGDKKGKGAILATLPKNPFPISSLLVADEVLAKLPCFQNNPRLT